MAKQFDASSIYEYPIQRDQEKVKAVVRFPTNDEWAERSRQRVIKTRSLGRMTENLPIDPGPDLRLYEKIRQDGSPDLTPEEATYVIGALARCEVVDVNLGDTEAEVDLIVCGGVRVKHRLRIPSKSDEVKMNRSSGTIYRRPNNIDEMRLYLEPVASVWKKYQTEIQGYAGEVPIIHQDGAVRSVLEAASQDPDIEAEDF